MIILLNFFLLIYTLGFFKVITLELALTFDKEIHIKYFDTITGRLLHIFVTFCYMHVHVKLIISTFFQILQ